MHIVINTQTGKSSVKLNKTELNQMRATMLLCNELRGQKIPNSLNPFTVVEELTKIIEHFTDKPDKPAKPEKPADK